MKKIALTVAFLLAGFAVGVATSRPSQAKSGCCSHHGGVCGCAGIRALCCDGTTSPSCDCG